MHFRVEVIADSSGRWCGNDLVFTTREEGEKYARDLANRWTLVREWRVVEADEPVDNDTLSSDPPSPSDRSLEPKSAATITVTLGPITRVYRTLCTTAPSAYDAGTSITLATGPAGAVEGLLNDGVIAIYKETPARVVLVEDSLFDWHRARYASGLYPSAMPDPDLFGPPEVAAELLRRLDSGAPSRL